MIFISFIDLNVTKLLKYFIYNTNNLPIASGNQIIKVTLG